MQLKSGGMTAGVVMGTYYLTAHLPSVIRSGNTRVAVLTGGVVTRQKIVLVSNVLTTDR